MQQKIAPTQATVYNFIIAIRSGSVEEVKRYLDQYTNDLVNKLELQSRQPSLYFAVLIPDHNRSYEIMKMLIEHGANPNFKDQYIQTVFFYACRQGKEKCVDLLLQHNVAVDEQDGYGQTPLYYIARQNRLNLLEKIKDRVNFNHTDQISNQTALFYSAREGHLQMCKLLIQYGCDVSHQDNTHKTAAHYAKKNGKNDVYEYLNSELQKIKQQKKFSAIAVPADSKSKEEDKKIKKKKPVEAVVTKQSYKLVRMDQKGVATDITEAEFMEWAKDFPEIQMMLRSPDDIDPVKIEQTKIQQNWEKQAMKVLNYCWKLKGAYFFHQPVDPKKYGIIDYFDVVKNPMDFGTVKRKLTHNVYQDVKEFVEDMMLVFSNCVLYNSSESDLGRLSIEIQKQFEESARLHGLLTE